MAASSKARWNRQPERGISLLMVAIGLLVLLGISVLAIDLVSLYVGRNEAQRAADAAALAGAKVFVDTACTSSTSNPCSSQTGPGTQAAISIGGQNNVGGQAANIQGADVTFDFSIPGDPRITVVVQRTAARGNAMPTFFAKAFGVLSADIRAQATAEAYNPSGSPTGPTICAGCVKPFSMPNCDPDPLHAFPVNPACATPGQGYFVDPTGAIAHPGAYPGGVVGERWTLHYNSGPSQYSDVDTGCGSGNQTPCISACSSATWACGNTLNTVQGDRAGQIRQGIRDLIHATANGLNHGQDTINTNVTPFQITGGSNNPNPAAVGQTITNSDSLVTVVLYDGHSVPPGIQPVIIVGYMQMFIESVSSGAGGDAEIAAVILNISGCGIRTGQCGNSGGGLTGGTVQGGNGSLIPIRLIRSP